MTGRVTVRAIAGARRDKDAPRLQASVLAQECDAHRRRT